MALTEAQKAESRARREAQRAQQRQYNVPAAEPLGPASDQYWKDLQDPNYDPTQARAEAEAAAARQRGSAGGRTTGGVQKGSETTPGTTTTEPDPEPTDSSTTVDYRGLAYQALGTQLPMELIEVLADAWAETGNYEVALLEMRRSANYEVYFPGNRRPDNTVRYTEADFRSREEAFDRFYQEFVGKTPPSVIKEGYRKLHEESVSVVEWRDRIKRRADYVRQTSPYVQNWARNNYGIEPDLPSMIEAYLTKTPVIPEDVFRRQLQGAEVGGTAAEFGFDRDAAAVEGLMQQGLDTGEEARQVYSQAAEVVPGAGRNAQRYFEGSFGVADFEQAALGRADAAQRLRRIQQRSQSAFSRAGSVATRDGALTGLRPR